MRDARTAAVCLGLASRIVADADCNTHKTGPTPLHVAAAADLAFAFEELGALYEKTTGQKVVLSFGSSGQLAAQIAEGAPFDVFAAASVSFAEEAVASGACLADTETVYARGRIVLFAPKAASFAPNHVGDLTDARIARVAIANPSHAPYGRAAKQALERAGVWGLVAPKVVYGESVQQALQFAQSGNADVAIVALSLAVVSPGDYAPIPPSLHDPLDQALVVCRRGKSGVDAARRFAALVASSEGQAVMLRYGFLPPPRSP